MSFPASGGAEPCTGSNSGDPRGIRRVHVRARGHAEAALERGTEVGHDIAEEVVGDDDLEGRRVLHEQQAERVHVEVPRSIPG